MIGALTRQIFRPKKYFLAASSGRAPFQNQMLHRFSYIYSRKIEKKVIFSVNKEKRALMLEKMLAMEDHELLENHSKIIRAIVNSSSSFKNPEEKSKVQNRLKVLFDRVTSLIDPTKDLDILYQMLQFQYPLWFRFECSASLFNLYDKLISYMYEKQVNLNRDSKDSNLAKLPDFSLNSSSLHSSSWRELKSPHRLLTQYPLDATFDNLIEMFRNNTMLEFTLFADTQVLAIDQMSSDQVDDTLEFLENVQAQKIIDGLIEIENKQKTAKEAKEDQERGNTGSEIGFKFGKLDKEKSRLLLDKLYYMVSCEFRERDPSEFIPLMSIMKAANYYDPYLMDSINVRITNQFNKIGLNCLLVFIDIVIKSKMNPPYQLFYSIKNRFSSRTSDLKTYDVFNMYRLLKKIKLYHYDSFLDSLLSTLLEQKHLENLSSTKKAHLLLMATKTSYKPQIYSLMIIELSKIIDSMTLLDFKLSATGIASILMRFDDIAKRELLSNRMKEVSAGFSKISVSVENTYSSSSEALQLLSQMDSYTETMFQMASKLGEQIKKSQEKEQEKLVEENDSSKSKVKKTKEDKQKKELESETLNPPSESNESETPSIDASQMEQLDNLLSLIDINRKKIASFKQVYQMAKKVGKTKTKINKKTKPPQTESEDVNKEREEPVKKSPRKKVKA